MVLSEGRLLVRTRVSVRRLVGFLRQRGYDELVNCVVSSTDVLRVDFRHYLLCDDVSCPEAQSHSLRATVRSVGSVFHLPALRSRQRARSGSLIRGVLAHAHQPALQLVDFF